MESWAGWLGDTQQQRREEKKKKDDWRRSCEQGQGLWSVPLGMKTTKFTTPNTARTCWAVR